MKIRLGKDKKEKSKGFVSAVIVAAGSSSRMGGVDKLASLLAGETVIARSIRAFQDSEDISEIVLVLRKGAERSALEGASGCDKVSRIVHGGSTRTESSYAGVMACDPEAEIILIHDGARPLVTKEVIRSAVEGARKYGAAVPVTPVADTIKVGKDGFADSTPDRASLFAAQTPQAFRAELIKAGLQNARDKGLSLTDDCAAVEKLGMHVKLVEGDPCNRKITLPADLALAEALFKERNP